MKNDVILVGCADGGLRLLHMDHNGYIDTHPKLWEKLNGISSPGITCICADESTGLDPNEFSLHGVSGGVDGSITLFQLRRMS